MKLQNRRRSKLSNYSKAHKTWLGTKSRVKYFKMGDLNVTSGSKESKEPPSTYTSTNPSGEGLEKASTGAATQTKKENKPEGQWENQLDFFMACIGYAAGLGNLWRFPYLCYKNGGGAFLIPYLFTLAVAGIPIFLLESSLGQMIGTGVLGVFDLCPIFKGVGYAMLISLFLMNIYYMQLLSWAQYYFFHSLQPNLPWGSCRNAWNSEYCFREDGNGCSKLIEYKELHPNSYLNITTENCKNPVEEFWIRNVLQRSDSLTDFSEFNYLTAFFIFAAWAFCCYNIGGGIKSSGLIIYFTALFPYFCLLVLFLRGVTLPGAMNGLHHFFVPNFESLKDPNVWNDAATQVFYSYGICVGCWMALSSRNKYRHNMVRDSVVICLLNCATAMFSGMTVFSIIGFLAHDEGKPIDTVVESGVGLAFVVYPEAALRLPFSPFWSALFFAMFFSLGMGSMFVMGEGFFKGAIDEFDIIKRHDKLFIFATMMFSVIVGMLFSFGCGVYWLELFNYYSTSGFALLAIALFELISIFWIYGGEKYIAMCEDMMRLKIGGYWRYTWIVIAPILCFGIFVFSLVIYKPLQLDYYTFPPMGIAFGICLALSSMLAIPIYAIYRVIISPGATLGEKFTESITSTPEVLRLIKLRGEEGDMSEKMRFAGKGKKTATQTTTTESKSNK